MSWPRVAAVGKMSACQYEEHTAARLQLQLTFTPLASTVDHSSLNAFAQMKFTTVYRAADSQPPHELPRLDTP